MKDSATKRTLQGRRILLIEDNRDVQQFVSGIARLERADIAVARSGEEGLDLLADDARFDAILLDLNLPGISGWDVLRSLRSTPPHWEKEPPVFIFTASNANMIEEQASELGAAGVITKPVSARDLVQALAAA
ncbi:MAG: response regulator [Dehalococcoidia bacterium]